MPVNKIEVNRNFVHPFNKTEIAFNVLEKELKEETLQTLIVKA